MKKIMLFALLVCVLFGCEQPGTIVGPETDGSAVQIPESFAESGSIKILANTDGPYYDWSYDDGNSIYYIEVNYHKAIYRGTVNDVTVSIGPEEVLVGGYAYTLGYQPSLSSGAFLTACNPVIDNYISYGSDEDGNPYLCDARSWHGRSLGACYQTPTHYLVVVAVGMRLRGAFPTGQSDSTGLYMKREVLLNYMRYTSSADSAYAAHPQATATMWKDFTLIGGGAEVLDTGGAGNFLTNTYGYFDYNYGYYLGRWYACSKDHCYSSPARIRAYAIGIVSNKGTDTSISSWGNVNNASHPLTLESGIVNGWADPSLPVSVGTGRGSAVHYINGEDESWAWPVVLGVGAKTTYNNGYGRMLTGLRISPRTSSSSQIVPQSCVIVDTQDYGTADAGTVTAQIMGMFKDYGDPTSPR